MSYPNFRLRLQTADYGGDLQVGDIQHSRYKDKVLLFNKSRISRDSKISFLKNQEIKQANLLQKLALLGVAVFGAISFTGIAVIPAQAAGFGQSSELRWTGDVSNFARDAKAAIENEGSFDLTFNFLEELSVRGVDGDFDPYFPKPDLPADFPTVASTVTFEFLDKAKTILGFQTSAEFKIGGNLIVPLFTPAAPDDPVMLTLLEGSIFTVSLDSNGAAQSTLESGELEAVLPGTPDGDPDISGIANSITLTFDQSGGSIRGGYSATADFSAPPPGIDPRQVPEPASILGFLTIGSLGLGLKRKKQS